MWFSFPWQYGAGSHSLDAHRVTVPVQPTIAARPEGVDFTRGPEAFNKRLTQFVGSYAEGSIARVLSVGLAQTADGNDCAIME